MYLSDTSCTQVSFGEEYVNRVWHQHLSIIRMWCLDEITLSMKCSQQRVNTNVAHKTLTHVHVIYADVWHTCMYVFV